MTQRIKNKHYRQFLDEGIIHTLTEDDLHAALDNVTGKHQRQGRSLIICMYYTGARPVEALQLKARHISKRGSYVLVRLAASKHGLPRTPHLQYKRPLVKEFYQYARSLFQEMYLFHNYRTKYTRKRLTKKGIKEYVEITDGLRYWFKKWFKNVTDEPIPPYYLRHNRFSKLSEAGATMEEIRILKGSKTFTSVTPYLHMSSRAAKKLAKKME